MTALRFIFVALFFTLVSAVVHAEVSGVYGTSMKPEDQGTQWIVGAEYTIRSAHRWRATKLFVEDQKVDISGIDHNDRTFDYNDHLLYFTVASLSPRSGPGGSAGIALLFPGWGEVTSPTNRKLTLGYGAEAFVTLSHSWRVIPAFGIDFGASATGRWVEYDGDAEGEYWSYTVAPILSPYVIAEIEPINGGIKVYAGPMLHWGEVFMEHENALGVKEEICLVHRDMWGVYGGVGLTIHSLYVGVRAEFLSALTLKLQAGFSF